MSAGIVTVAQQKGGAGKTTLAVQLAVTLAADGRRVVLIDIDPQKSGSAWHAVRDGKLGGENTIALTSIAGWKLDSALNRQAREADVVIIDSPPHAETEAKAAIRAADLVLVPLQPSPMDLWAIDPTLDLADAHGAAPLIVLNRVPPRGKLADTMRAALAERNLPVSAAQLGNRQAFAASMMNGRGVVETDKRSPAADEIRRLAAEVRERLAV